MLDIGGRHEESRFCVGWWGHRDAIRLYPERMLEVWVPSGMVEGGQKVPVDFLAKPTS